MSDWTQSDGAFRAAPPPPWARKKGLGHVLESFRADAGMRHCFALDHLLPAREASYAPMPDQLHPAVQAALRGRGIRQLYSHQAESFRLARAGSDVVVSTPTASGKSLCYNLPVLDALARDGSARALYLFPTKALARDQEEALKALMREAGLDHGPITYDGDTPGDARRAARERSGILLTNPDMLHAGILPHHASWARVFASLRFVVVDELHTYRGVFGSHLANVLRRLLRIAAFHGSAPVVIFASATIGNPRAHAERMVGRSVAEIGESGAPAGPRNVLVYNPPIVNSELGIRQSYLKAAVRIASDLIRAEVPTLVFGQGRNQVETMLKYLRDRLVRDRIDPESIQGYRGGYLPDLRRRIEAGLRAGEIRCVVATNALELGIDIGSLDAVVCAGYPGSIAGLWQRFGRAGRRQDGSLAVLVASSAPLDQYCATDPNAIIGAPIEHARIDPDNVEILVQHLKCAAFELPFQEGETFGSVSADDTTEALDFLAQHQLLHPVPGASGARVFHWASDAYPANHVSLRSLSWDNFVVIDLDRDKTIAEMDFRSTHTMLHVQAIYQHEGEQYQVERLDFENHKAYVRKVEPDYFTTAMTYTKVEVIEEQQTAPLDGAGLVGLGEVSVVEKVVGYKKIKFHTHENVGYGEVRLPEMQMQTTAFWLLVPESVVEALPYARPTVIDALRGLGNALHTVAAVGLMIDPRDLGLTLGDRNDEHAPPGKRGGAPGFDPTVFLYDHVPAGVGLAPRLLEAHGELLVRARALALGCSCRAGCPACIGPEIGQVVTPAGALSTTLASVVPRKQVITELLDALGIRTVH
ncbi:MAG: ATP-dependent helicase, box family [Myxococcaceae bacterium]|nr:ATP-dependent helicase, box family [Myxococcaceae bacterium]